MASFVEFFRSLPGVVHDLFQPDDTTRALSVELWTVVPAVLVLVQFGVSSMGPRFVISSHVNPGIELLRILSYYSVSYTLGLMKPSVSGANDFFQVWAVLIVTMQDSARIGRPYRPKEMTLIDLLSSLWSANQLRSQTQLYLKVPLWSIWCIHAWRIISYYTTSNAAAGANVDNMKLVSDYMALPGGHIEVNACPHTMTGYKYLVAGEDRQKKDIDKPKFRLKLEETRPQELITVDKVWNWSRESSDGGAGADDSLLGRHTDSDNKFKDVCLSFALYKLLRRRLCGISIPEANNQASGRLVSDALLDNTNDPNYDRVFRVTEVELSFLQDFSYSKHATVFARGFPYHRQLLSSCMIAAALYLAYSVGLISGVSDNVGRITHGVLVTHFLIFIVVFRELLEMWVYVMSQWSKVLVVCHYIRIKLYQDRRVAPLGSGEGGQGHVQVHPEAAPLNNGESGADHVQDQPEAGPVGARPGPEAAPLPQRSWIAEKVARIMLGIFVLRLHRWIVEKVARIMFRFIHRGEWNQKIEQHNLLMVARVSNRSIRYLFRKRYVKLRSEVKTKIFESLKALIRQIDSSHSSIQRNDSSESSIQRHDSSESSIQNRNNKVLLSYLASAFANSRKSLPVPSLIEVLHNWLDGDTHKILAWHVATSLCQIQLLEESGRDRDDLYTLPTSSFGDPGGFAALWPDYTTAVTVSNYCVHLVTVALIPDNGLVASKVFEEVQKEAREALRDFSTWAETRDKLKADASVHDESPEGRTIVKIGSQLAVELMSKYGRDDLWERLGKFWTGYLLYLSASTRASKHQTHLQGRGELTTHLWALLSHAGFLGVNTEHGQLLLDPVDLNAA